jgi:O-glycosyl hydrolase
MARLQEKHPEIRMTFIEKSEFGVDGMYFIQQYFRNWSTCYLSWVTMSTQQLDEHNQGPYNKPGELSPTLFIQKDGVTSEWYKIPEFYMLSQFSRFIQPGACRIECTPGSPNRLTAISFINPDQTIITVLVNQTDKDQSFRVIYQGKQFHARLPRKTVGTYLWVE